MHRGGFQSICQKYGPVYLPRTVKDQRFDNGYVLFLRMEDAAKFKAAINGSGPLKLGRTPETAQDYYLRAEWAYPEGSGNGAGGGGDDSAVLGGGFRRKYVLGTGLCGGGEDATAVLGYVYAAGYLGAADTAFLGGSFLVEETPTQCL